MSLSTVKSFLTDSKVRRLFFKENLFLPLGYDYTHWCRKVQIEHWKDFIRARDPSTLDALEISPERQPTWIGLGFRSYTRTDYPEFDICRDTLSRQFDIIIADNVFEHVEQPYAAGRNVHAMLRPGGCFLIATPFLIRVHGEEDFWRWTPRGMKLFLQEVGFAPEAIESHGWGSRACVRDNFTHWGKVGFFGSLRNEPDFPVTVWAYAHR